MNENDDLDALFEDDTPTTETVTEAPAEPSDAAEPAAEEAPDTPNEAPQADAPAGAETPPAEEAEAPAAPGETPAPPAPVEEQPAKPLTAEEVRSIVTNIRDEERNSGKELRALEDEVISKYYPEGLSNVLIDEKSGMELRTPQDVVDASGGEMSMEDAAKWLMNEQYKLDKTVSDIRESARELAQTNRNFKDGATRVIERYQYIFDRYPALQGKVYKNYMKAVKMDSEKDLILSAPDIEEYYADFMEPYVMALGAKPAAQAPAQSSPAQAATAPATIPESKQTPEDRMDISGDVGGGDGSDGNPNDPESSLNKLFGE